VPLFPPDLTAPFSGTAERAEAGRQLQHRDGLLRRIEELALTPANRWSSAERDVFPAATNGVPEPAPARLARWAALFADELAEVHRLAAAQRPLGDVALKEALYLAGRLLATASDRPIDAVDGLRIGPKAS